MTLFLQLPSRASVFECSVGLGVRDRSPLKKNNRVRIQYGLPEMSWAWGYPETGGQICLGTWDPRHGWTLRPES
eukprot:5295634-Pyramimonas_sp.AAC.1